MDKLEFIQSLRDYSGMSMNDCKQAFEFCNGNYDLAVAYLKAKCTAVATPNMTFDERVQYFYKNDNK